MANWFKVYETDLDDTRLKYALNKLPEVGWVWMGILSECCKQRSDTIRWSPKEHELFGFSDRLKVSIPKINEAIILLVEIEYVERVEGGLKVPKWPDKQSDYCVRKDRGDYKKNGQYRRVSDNIGDSPREEKRGDEKEKRGEDAGDDRFPYVDELKTKAWVALMNQAGADFTDDERHRALLNCRANNWMWGKNAVADPRAAFESQLHSLKDKRKTGGVNGHKPDFVAKKDLEDLISKHVCNRDSIHHDEAACTVDKRNELTILISKLERLQKV